MANEVFLTKNAAETQALAGKIIEDFLVRTSAKTAAVLALIGELGGGKTTFVQGLARVLGIKERILSPTFVIMRRFSVRDGRLFPERSPAAAARRSRRVSIKNLYHIDCYRLNSPKELDELNFKKIISQPENLVVIEWADKVRSLIPKNAVWISFEWKREKERKIMINSKIKKPDSKLIYGRRKTI